MYIYIYMCVCCECGVHVHVIQHASSMTLRLCLARRPFAILPSGGWDEDLAKVGSYGSKGSGLTGSPKRDIRLDSGLGTNLSWILVHVRIGSGAPGLPWIG